MNRLGYVYLSGKRVSEALAAFRLNIEAYPESFNVYDSYGEALMADHQYEQALRHYARSVEMNSSNNNGREKLAELRRLLSAPGIR
jgi:tetratricopeptide (TPR) repeat protein